VLKQSLASHVVAGNADLPLVRQALGYRSVNSAMQRIDTSDSQPAEALQKALKGIFRAGTKHSFSYAFGWVEIACLAQIPIRLVGTELRSSGEPHCPMAFMPRQNPDHLSLKAPEPSSPTRYVPFRQPAPRAAKSPKGWRQNGLRSLRQQTPKPATGVAAP
jgi:hypothetical protein